MDNTIRRLIAAGHVRRLEASTASVGGGASFTLPKQVINRLIVLEGADSRTIASSNSRTASDVSSSSYSTTTTNVDHHRRDAEKLQSLVAYLNLDEAFNVGANDLLVPFQESGGSLEHFAESTEHAAFYLSTSDAKTINHPKAWLIKQLRRGYYPAPANFRSREAQLEEAKIQARECKAKEMSQLRARKLEVEFECWLAEQDSKARQAILAAQEVGPDFATAQMIRGAFRKHFATMTGALEFLE